MIVLISARPKMGKTVLAAGAFYKFPRDKRVYVLFDGPWAVSGLMEPADVSAVPAAEIGADWLAQRNHLQKMWDRFKQLASEAAKGDGIFVADQVTDFYDLLMTPAIESEMRRERRDTGWGKLSKQVREEAYTLFRAMAYSKATFLLLMHTERVTMTGDDGEYAVEMPVCNNPKRMDVMTLQFAQHSLSISGDTDRPDRRLLLTAPSKGWHGLGVRMPQPIPDAIPLPYDKGNPHKTVEPLFKVGLLSTPAAKNDKPENPEAKE